MPKMKAMQVPAPEEDFKLVEKEIPAPATDEVLSKVQACGICHSDAFVKDGMMPGIEYPRVPGHEVVGTIEQTGEEVNNWTEGQRVGVGWHGGHCYRCEPCRDGDFINCENGKVTGMHYDGGYAEYLTAPESALAAIPTALDSAEAAPLLCAGITTFNALRNSDLEAGDTVAVQGIGGLGHLGIQYANKMGCKTVALSRGTAKRKLAHNLGAETFIDTESTDAAKALQEMGGADVILATAPNSNAITSIVDGLGRNGQLMVVAATNEPVEVAPFQLIAGRRSIAGWPSGDAKDSEDTLKFSALKNVSPKIETFALEEANEAYDRMINNEARFRVVLEM